jgi:hypothetical protein
MGNKKGRKFDLATALRIQRRYKSNKRENRVPQDVPFRKWFLTALFSTGCDAEEIAPWRWAGIDAGEKRMLDSVSVLVY